jgi:hypothetical protein
MCGAQYTFLESNVTENDLKCLTEMIEKHCRFRNRLREKCECDEEREEEQHLPK